jgi:hypothetical protein
MAIDDVCPLDAGTGDCIAKSTNSGSGSHGFISLALDVGLYYVMIDTWPSPNCIPQFTLTIAAGQTQENDDWDKCEEIGDVENLAFTTSGMTFDGPGVCQTAPNIWYCYTATCNGDAVASLCGSSYDTKMAVYDGVGDPAGLTMIACNDDACGLQSEIEWTAVMGNSYLIEVGGYGSNTGSGVITTSCTEACPPPPNDNCEDVTPTVIPINTSATFTGNNCGATNQCTLLSDNGHAWEAFTINQNADVIVDYCGTTPNFELIYIVLAPTCPCENSELVYASSTNWGLCGGDGNVTIYYPALPAGTYYIPVLSDHPDYPTYYYEGPYTINVTASEVDYCPASGGCDEYIANVTVGSINNSTGCDGYGDYTALSTNMVIGMGYPITITLGGAWASDWGAVWVDWNQDKIFDPVAEAVSLDVYQGYGPYTGTVTVPMSALPGPTRMRVRLTYASEPEPCGTTSYGEVEDYTVVVGGEPTYFTYDPASIDFGVVGAGSTGGTPLTLGADGPSSLDYSIEVVYPDKDPSTRHFNNTLSVTPAEKAPYSGPEAPPADENVIRQGGDNIGSAVAISMPYSGSGTTSGYTNDYDEVCPFTGSTAPDVVYSYAPTANKVMDVDMWGSIYDTKIYVYEDGAGTLVACNDDYYSDYTSALFDVPVNTGHIYYIVIDGYGSSNGEYTINASIDDPPEPFECPPGSVAENEACGDDTNGGCNMATPSFEPINCGDTVCGYVWADAGTRDTDWYLLHMNKAGPITWTATAEFPVVIGYVEVGTPGAPDCATATQLNPYATGNPGDVISVTYTAPDDGDYWFFVSHQDYYDQPCGSGNGYWVTASCDQGEPPILWLSTDPESGSIPSNGTTEVSVNYDAAELENGVYTADLYLTHNGAERGLVIIPVQIEVGGDSIISIDPHPIYAFMEFDYGDSMTADIYLGGEFAGGGHVVSEINEETVQVNGLVPEATEILTSYPDYSGEVLKISVDITEFITSYELLWDVTVQTYTVTGEFDDTTPFSQAGAAVMIGHTSGDANFDGSINILDVTYIINYVYKGGPEPQPIMETGDANGSGDINILDVTRLINYLYNAGEPPSHP